MELENPLIIIHEKKISSINVVVKVLELALQKQRPLLIVAAYVESDLILNKLRARIKSLCQMEHENAKFLNAKRELSDENVSSYEKQRKSYEQLHHNVSLSDESHSLVNSW